MAIALLFGTCGRDELVTKYEAQNIVVLIVDGARWSETWGDSAGALIPHRSGELRQEGVMFTHFYNNGYTYTNSGHTAICTGFSQSINNTGQELPLYPSFMQYWLKATGEARNKAWVVTSKDKLAVLADCQEPGWAGMYNPMTDCGVNGLGTGYRDDSTTVEHLKNIISTDHPRIIVINFREPDFSGHAADWNAYRKGIRDTDKYAAEIWNMLQSNRHYAGKTAMFITNDHGRHLDSIPPGYVTHGDGCDGCRHIELLAMGPDFKRGSTNNQTWTHEDLTATIAEMLGIRMEYGTGQVIDHLFK